MKKFLSFLVFLFCASSAFSQLSKKHYIPPLTSTDGFTDQYIYISTPKANNVSYKITPIGNPDITAYSGVVSNANPVAQPVLDSAGFNDFDDDSQLHINQFNINGVINNKGFIIEANDVIYVSIRVRSALSGGDKFHAGALVSKGSSALGDTFRIGGFVRGSTPVDGHITFASLMATADNTTVNITNIPSGFIQPNGSSIPAI